MVQSVFIGQRRDDLVDRSLVSHTLNSSYFDTDCLEVSSLLHSFELNMRSSF